MDEPTEKKPDSTATETGGVTVTTPNERENLVLQKLQEMDRTQRALQQELDNTKEQLNKKPEPTVDDKNKQFYADPTKAIQEMLEKTVKPLIEFRDEVRSGTEYDRVKSEFKDNPKFKDFLALPGVESQIDKLMGNSPTKNRDAYLATILGLRGAIASGVIDAPSGYNELGKKPDTTNNDSGDKPKDDNKDVKVNTQIPPHLRPSSAPTPSNAEKPKTRDLTENEERLRKENKMSKEDYIEFTDNVRPDEVVNYVDQAKREKK